MNKEWHELLACTRRAIDWLVDSGTQKDVSPERVKQVIKETAARNYRYEDILKAMLALSKQDGSPLKLYFTLKCPGCDHPIQKRYTQAEAEAATDLFCTNCANTSVISDHDFLAHFQASAALQGLVKKKIDGSSPSAVLEIEDGRRTVTVTVSDTEGGKPITLADLKEITIIMGDQINDGSIKVVGPVTDSKLVGKETPKDEPDWLDKLLDKKNLLSLTVIAAIIILGLLALLPALKNFGYTPEKVNDTIEKVKP